MTSRRGTTFKRRRQHRPGSGHLERAVRYWAR